MNKIKYEMIDLKENYDYNLLKRFYEEFMITNFPDPTELEPLENWVDMFEKQKQEQEQKKIKKNENYNKFENIFFGGSIGANSVDDNQIDIENDGDSDGDGDGDDDNKGEIIIDFHIVLSICSPDQVIEGQSNILGGVVFEYYPSVNCGCITYILVNGNYRGQGLAGILLKEANNRMNENANYRDHLGGCNAIFLETNSAEKVKPENDVMDPAKRHLIFHKLGIRLLDFDYVQPALSSESGKCKDLLLLCLLTSNIPKHTVGSQDDSGEDCKYYIPSLLLADFLRVFWNCCYSRITPRIDWKKDLDYQRMLDQLNRRDKIQLLDLPWNRPWTLIDLRDSFYSKPLISKFYNDLLVPNFKYSFHELEPLENWFRMLPGGGSDDDPTGIKNHVYINDDRVDFHLLVALRYHSEDDDNDNDDDNKQTTNVVGKQHSQEPIICGGLSFEYHATTNCGLITYFLVGGGANNRAENMARALIQRAIEILEQNAIECGNLAGCNAIFLETSHQPTNYNNSASTYDDENQFTEISYRKEFLEKMGWMKLDFSYIQPPLSINSKSKPLNLLILLTPRIPIIQQQQQQQTSVHLYYLPNSLIINFVESFWRNTCKRIGGNDYLTIDKDYKIMIDSLIRRNKIPLLSSSLDWNRPFILIDLAQDFNQDLFNNFYSSLPSNIDIETNIILEKLLSKHSKKLNSKFKTSHISKTKIEKQKEDIHILLLVSYNFDNDSNDSNNQICPTILGSIIFSYFPISNCGLISKILIRKLSSHNNNNHLTNLYGFEKLSNEFNDIGLELLNESVKIINIISTSKTHISGPNAIFLETNLKIKEHGDGSINHITNNVKPFIINLNDEFIQIPFSFIIKKQGWLLVDIEYYQPPRNLIYYEQQQQQPSILCVLNTNQLPKLSSTSPFIPKDLFKNFLSIYWFSIFSRNQIEIQKYSLNCDSPNIKLNQQFKDKDKILLI